MLFNNTNMRTAMAYTNAVGDKVYPIIVDIKKGIKSTEEVSFVSSDINTGVLSVAFIQGNDTYNVEGAEVICSIMRPDTTTLEIPCNIINGNTIEVPLGVNGTSQDGVYSFDFKVFKGGNKIVGTPIMNYSVSLSISNDLVVEEDDRLPVLTMLMTQVNELKEETRETINQANVATEASREATANAIEATNTANAVSERVSQETATAISEIKQDTENAIASVNQSTNDAIASMTQKTDEAVTMINDSLANVTNVVTTKVAELDNAKSDMTTTVSNKVNEVETRFNALTSKQQQDAEVIDARDGETSLKARLDRDIEKAKQVYVNVEGSNISTDSSVGYAKDVEILGNTVQDASNLADIRSVGDTVEGQELYEIPVLIKGKNLFNPNSPLVDMGSPSYNNAREILVRANTYYAYTSTPYTGAVSVNFYKSDDTLISSTVVSSGQNFSTPVECKKIRIHTDVDSKIQIEEGTQATSYEPYQEDKLTILSPVQLEKVGDVADRIICKDGVWGVEKMYQHNWDNISFTSPISQFDNDDLTGKYNVFRLMKSQYDLIEKGIYPFFRLNGSFDTEFKPYDGECVWGSGAYLYFKILKGKTTLDEFKAGKSFDFIVLSDNPTFIPLPHDQQVKLRTFANKTNISFLTEIEGTIKAQVPKSIGATVNTHTEQINNLNKELDRVKKLEESTVSTVTTESDFTTVEATSNGYFEDVKLEGKTLVNLWDANNIKTSGQIVVKSNRITVTTTSNIFSNFYYEQKSKFKPSTEYTIIVDIYKNTLKSNDKIYITSCNGGVDSDNRDIFSIGSSTEFTITGSTVGRVVRKYTTISDFSGVSHAMRSFIANSSQTEGAELELTITVLEGDHTQNPPSYFEGLMSVGQSASEDGADEISVLSASLKGNLFYGDLIEDTYIDLKGGELSVPTWRSTTYINIKENTIYTQNYIPRDAGYNAFYDKDKKFISAIQRVATFETPKNACYMRTCFEKTNGTDYILVMGENIPTDLGKIEDKKRLLYYNNETQAWEKPILRQWDSIEKHADGKYYYHQRSGEALLNGSESWTHVTEQIGENTLLFYAKLENSLGTEVTVGNYKVLVDKFNFSSVSIWDKTIDNELCMISPSQNFMLRINKSRLATQDVEGFKQWLQANNVTVVYQLAEEKVYECTNIDLITYANETNYVVESGAIVPRTTLKVHNNISNVVKILQEKVSLLENKFIEGLKKVLAGDMYSLAELLYPEDFVEENPENNIMLLPFE